ncbi:hypothetical protein [Pedobacter frigiditerrae]|uniref:hypothetical protein n=1 Tax=Pedobacter frigiditerrae TaxID=2530452 RepID=UPI00292CAE79|nr:hypothetical protein [Pedobacter frigiditerrae]
MKLYTILILLAVFSTITGCNKFKSDHPQAEITDQYTTDLTANSILHYADSINKNLNRYTKATSLVYMLGDLSFYVEKYSEADQPILLIEHAFNGGVSNSLKKYYFRNDSLILEEEKNQLANDDGSIFKDSRTFLRSNTIFKVENRTASVGGEIKSLPFLDVPLSVNKTADKTLLDNVKTLNDVINRVDRFDVVFESITTFPDSRYIVLRSKIQNSYTASILVQEKDAFIDSLLNDPMTFKDQKLNFTWAIKDKEAVYVPVSNNTSASGLKR